MGRIAHSPSHIPALAEQLDHSDVAASACNVSKERKIAARTCKSRAHLNAQACSKALPPSLWTLPPLLKRKASILSYPISAARTIAPSCTFAPCSIQCLASSTLFWLMDFCISLFSCRKRERAREWRPAAHKTQLESLVGCQPCSSCKPRVGRGHLLSSDPVCTVLVVVGKHYGTCVVSKRDVQIPVSLLPPRPALTGSDTVTLRQLQAPLLVTSILVCRPGPQLDLDSTGAVLHPAIIIAIACQWPLPLLLQLRPAAAAGLQAAAAAPNPRFSTFGLTFLALSQLAAGTGVALPTTPCFWR